VADEDRFLDLETGQDLSHPFHIGADAPLPLPRRLPVSGQIHGQYVEIVFQVAVLISPVGVISPGAMNEDEMADAVPPSLAAYPPGDLDAVDFPFRYHFHLPGV